MTATAPAAGCPIDASELLELLHSNHVAMLDVMEHEGWQSGFSRNRLMRCGIRYWDLMDRLGKVREAVEEHRAIRAAAGVGA